MALALLSGLGVLSSIGLFEPILVIASLFFMIIPGYTMSILVFPRANLVERLFLSLGFSLGLFIGLQLILETSGFIEGGGITSIILSAFSALVFSIMTIERMRGIKSAG